MDVNNEIFEEFSKNESTMSAPKEIKLPLPPEDFDEFGKVKTVRGRMLKKLFKQEIRFYKPITSLLLGLVLVAGIIFSILLKLSIEQPEQFSNTFFSMMFIGWTLIYVYGAIGASIFSAIYPVWRYNKNFFHSEGYLTFSIPASAEEQLLAKRLAALLCQAVCGLVIIISVVILCCVVGIGPEMWQGLGKVFSAIGTAFLLEPVHAVFFTIEVLLLLIVSTIMMPCVYGAVSCLLSKSTGKKKLGKAMLLIFLVVGAVESVVAGATQVITIPLMSMGAVGVHISLWLTLIVYAAVTIGCWLFELHFLKKKLDLK